MASTDEKIDSRIIHEGVKAVTALKFLLAAVIALVAFGAATSRYWLLPSAVAEHTGKIRVLEQHHAVHEVQLGNIERSQSWQQDTLFKLTEKVGVPGVKPAPTAEPIPTPAPISQE